MKSYQPEYDGNFYLNDLALAETEITEEQYNAAQGLVDAKDYAGLVAFLASIGISDEVVYSDREVILVSKEIREAREDAGFDF